MFIQLSVVLHSWANKRFSSFSSKVFTGRSTNVPNRGVRAVNVSAIYEDHCYISPMSPNAAVTSPQQATQQLVKKPFGHLQQQHHALLATSSPSNTTSPVMLATQSTSPRAYSITNKPHHVKTNHILTTGGAAGHMITSNVITNSGQPRQITKVGGTMVSPSRNVPTKAITYSLPRQTRTLHGQHYVKTPASKVGTTSVVISATSAPNNTSFIHQQQNRTAMVQNNTMMAATKNNPTIKSTSLPQPGSNNHHRYAAYRKTTGLPVAYSNGPIITSILSPVSTVNSNVAVQQVNNAVQHQYSTLQQRSYVYSAPVVNNAPNSMFLPSDSNVNILVAKKPSNISNKYTENVSSNTCNTPSQWSSLSSVTTKQSSATSFYSDTSSSTTTTTTTTTTTSSTTVQSTSSNEVPSYVPSPHIPPPPSATSSGNC